MNFEPSERSAELLERVKHFIRTRIRPVEAGYWSAIHEQHHGGDCRRSLHGIPPVGPVTSKNDWPNLLVTSGRVRRRVVSRRSTRKKAP